MVAHRNFFKVLCGKIGKLELVFVSPNMFGTAKPLVLAYWSSTYLCFHSLKWRLLFNRWWRSIPVSMLLDKFSFDKILKIKLFQSRNYWKLLQEEPIFCKGTKKDHIIWSFTAYLWFQNTDFFKVVLVNET